MRRALRRLARAQLRKAVDSLQGAIPLSGRIHAMRTSIKKVRALSSLARPAVGRPARRADGRLRAIGAATSALRDGEISLKAFDAIARDARSTAAVREGALKVARTRLLARLGEAERRFDSDDTASVLCARLLRERHRAKRWVPPGRHRRLKRLPAAPFAQTYRRARRGMRRAFTRRTGVAFHAWRKAVKAHRYQLQLLESAWPSGCAARLEDLERLGQLLGDEHDLAVLQETLTVDPAYFPELKDRQRFAALLRSRRTLLQAETQPLGQRLFAERTRSFRRRLREGLHQAARTSGTLPHDATATPSADSKQVRLTVA